VIGQACEFDYSGTQAVKTLKDEGYRIVLVNSNPATIMTDPELADAPISSRSRRKSSPDHREGTLHYPAVSRYCRPWRPDRAELRAELAQAGTLAKIHVEMIGATADAIDKAEDRGRSGGDDPDRT